MPFIGTQPEVGGYSVLDALTASATASYTLQLNSANFVPSSANQLLVSLNGVIQKPGSSFTISGSTLTFSSALDSSDSIDFIIAMGEPLLVGTPSDATITGNKLANNIAITTSGNVSSSGNIATTGSGTITSAGLITASSGVAIGGTGSANTLDDYEEGSWTPIFVAAGGSATWTYDRQEGYYTKVGKMVYIQGTLKTATVSNVSSGTYDVGGLPFTVSGGGTYGTTSVINAFAQSGWADAPHSFDTVASATTMRAREGIAIGAGVYTNGNTDGFTANNSPNNRVFFSGWYETT